MKRSPFKIRANMSNNPEIIKLYKKQRNYNINLSRKVKLKYSQKHIPQDASLKSFLKPFLSNKTTNFVGKIIRVEKYSPKLRKFNNNYFNNITKGLDIKMWCISNKLSLVNTIRKYENHSNIINHN